MNLRKVFRIIAFFTLLFFLLSACRNTTNNNIIEIKGFKSNYVAPRNLSIWLPPGYDEEKTAGYPVLYMHDGQNLFDSLYSYGGKDWGVDEWIPKLVSENKIPPVIVVGIWNTHYRFREYNPSKPFNTLPDSLKQLITNEYGGPALGDEYLKFIVTELKPYIDSVYNTQPERDNTIIMGSSMGGLISAYALVEYPDIFSKAGCLSTHWPVLLQFNDSSISYSNVQHIAAHLPKDDRFKIYFDRGTETLDAWYGDAQQMMDNYLIQQGVQKDKQWKSMVFNGDAHNELYWNQRLDIPLVFLLQDLK